MSKLTIVLLLCAGCTTISLPPNNPDLLDAVKADCKAWLAAHVRIEGKIKSIALFNPELIHDLTVLRAKLISVNVHEPLTALRYKRIAERYNEPIPSEDVIVRQFITAAVELDNE